MPHIASEKIPPNLRAVLCGGRTVAHVVLADEAPISGCASDGKRAEVRIVDQHGSIVGCYRGSYGGPNPFETSHLDALVKERGGRLEVPVDGFVTSGYAGEAPYTIYARAHVVAKLLGLDAADADVIRDAVLEQGGRAEEVFTKLAPQGPQVPNLWRWVLYVYSSTKGGYREGELDRIAERLAADTSTASLVASRTIVRDAVDQCVKAGYLKRNRAGATSITAEGTNLARRASYDANEIRATWEATS